MLNVGDVVPDFALPNQDGKLVRLSDFRGRRVVIFTFPAAGSMGCTMQACDLRDAYADLVSGNTVVLGISVDTPADLKAWKDQRALPYDLLSDPDHPVLEMLEGWRVKVLGIELPYFRNRTLWVLDEDGRVFEKHVPVMPVGNGRIARAALNRMEARETA